MARAEVFVSVLQLLDRTPFCVLDFWVFWGWMLREKVE
jgi:hypothetical protein